MSEINRTVLIVGNDCGYFVKHHQQIAKSAADVGYKVVVALPCRKKYIAGLVNHPFHFSKTSLNFIDGLKTIYDLIKLYRRIKPDLVHHFNIKIVLLGGIAARLANIGAEVNTISGLGYTFNQKQKSGIYALPVMSALKFACGGKKIINILFNNNDRNYLLTQNILDERRTRIINGTGVDLEHYRPVAPPNGLPVVLLPARLVYSKGIGEFVEAAEIVNRNKLRARFVVVGETVKYHPEEISLSQIRAWQASGNLEYWGYQKNIKEVYRQCAIVCLPSRYEGLPTVLLEAGACAKPIIATNIAGNRMVVKNGLNGLLVPVNNTKLLASAIIKLLDNKSWQIKLGKAGRKITENKFDSKIIAKKYLGIYRQLLFDR